MVTVATPNPLTVTAASSSSAGATTIELTSGGCTTLAGTIYRAVFDTTSNVFLGNTTGCNTGSDVLSLYAPLPVTINTSDSIAVVIIPLIDDPIIVNNTNTSVGGLESRRVTQISPTYPSDGKFWVNYPFSPDITAQNWIFSLEIANIACVACTSGGNSTPGYSGVTGLLTGNYGNAGQWLAGLENFIWLQHTFGYSVHSFQFDQAGTGFAPQDVTFYDSILGAGCAVTGCYSAASTGLGPEMATYLDAGPYWTTLVTNGTNLVNGYTFDNNNYTLTSYASHTGRPARTSRTSQFRSSTTTTARSPAMRRRCWASPTAVCRSSHGPGTACRSPAAAPSSARCSRSR